MNIKTLKVGKDIYNVGKNDKDKVYTVLRNWEYFSKKHPEGTPMETIKAAKDLFRAEKAGMPESLDVQSFMVDTFSLQSKHQKNLDLKSMTGNIINGLPEVKI